MLDGSDLRRKPLAERKAMLRKLLKRSKGGIQYVLHVEGHVLAQGQESEGTCCYA